jgi:prepilin-type N-terminal cleavage/methylation domain-containing protein
MKAYSKQVGFTLAEVLIVMAILGVVATFTVPKVLYSSNQASWNAKAKEAAAAISEAYTLYRMEKGVSASTKSTDILAYINSVGPYTGTINSVPGESSLSCTGTSCIQLHNGAVIMASDHNNFGGTTPNHGVWFRIDPDGQNTDGGTATPANGAVLFWLYANGGLRTWGTALSPTHYFINGSLVSSYGPTPSYDPTWFSWN